MPKPENGIRVVVAGASGRMGQIICQHLSRCSGIELVGAVDKDKSGSPVSSELPNLILSDKLGETLDSTAPHVLVDVTHPGAAAANAMSALKRGVAVVIGTSGLSQQDTRELALNCDEFKTPALLVPNFAVGAVLMMKFAEMAAAYMPNVEIIEMHHNQKADAPSGTAKSTAERISAARTSTPDRTTHESVQVDGARGGVYKEVRVHSVRLPGFLAHQQVLFGSAGETLTIRHDSNDRACFMGGVELAVRNVWNLSGFQVGLEKVMV